MEFYFRIFTFLMLFSPMICIDVKYAPGNPCTYFEDNVLHVGAEWDNMAGETRISSAEGNLVNCTWYSGNSCCKRTEVTSVFANMYPLTDSSSQCTDMLNYMMCYFCSPQQHIWYHGKVNVCEHYCIDLYKACRDAKYGDHRLGSSYPSGEAFCHGQGFNVVENTNECFDFDPDVFGTAITLQCSFVCLFVTVFLQLYNYLTHHS